MRRRGARLLTALLVLAGVACAARGGTAAEAPTATSGSSAAPTGTAGSATAILTDDRASYNQPTEAKAPIGRYQARARLSAAVRVAVELDPRSARDVRLSLESVTGDGKPLEARIRALAVADAPPVEALAVPPAPLTEASVSWSVPASVAGRRMESPDLSPLLRELAAGPGLRRGGHALFVIDLPEARPWHYRVFATGRGGSSGAPRLVAAAPSGGSAAPPSATPAPPVRVEPPPVRPAPLPAGAVPSRVRRAPDGRGWLEVDGQPYVVLAVQPDAWAIAKPTEAAAKQFEWAALTGANTVHIPIPWVLVEPRRDAYTMDYVDWVLQQARANDLRLTLTWFGSNVTAKTGSPTGLEIVPSYVVDDTGTYSRVGGPLKRPENVLDPSDPDTLEREKRAFERVLRHVRERDREGRVILWQILNEVGVLPDQAMRMSESKLRDDLIAYLRELAKLQKSIHPVPSYLNFWEGLKGVEPFTYLERIPEIDFVGPDLYGKPGGFHIADRDYRLFRGQFVDALGRYHRGRNLPFVPETNTDAYYRTHLSVFYLLGQVPGIGIDVWAVTTGSHRGYDPLVDRKSGELEEGGEKLREVYRAVHGAMGPIVRAQGSDRLGWFVSEEAGSGSITAGGIEVRYTAEDEGAALVAREPDGSLVIVARHARLTLPAPPSTRAEHGRFEGTRWVAEGPAAGPGAATPLVLEFGPARVVRVAAGAGER